MRDAGYIDRRSVRQAYDETAKMFLPDRYVKGICPVCGTADQYGDSCENCGSTYTPADLKNPISVVSGTPPVWRESEHYFFKLSAFEKPLSALGAAAARCRTSVARKLDEWFSQGLRDWDISRDAPYFGFEIPDAPGKYFYVWFDAPIGYLAQLHAAVRAHRPEVRRFSRRRFDAPSCIISSARTSCIFTPCSGPRCCRRPACAGRPPCTRTASSPSTARKCPSRAALSSRRGAIWSSFAPEYLRYYFAAKLGSGIDDIDMNLEEFTTRVNSDIVGKLVNIASRCAGFITKNAGGPLGGRLADPASVRRASLRPASDIAAAYEAATPRRAMRDIMALADRANQYIDSQKPWMLAKHAGQCGGGAERLHPGLESVPGADDLSAAGAAGHGRQGAALSSTKPAGTGRMPRRPCWIPPFTAYEPLATRLDAEGGGEAGGRAGRDGAPQRRPAAAPRTRAAPQPRRGSRCRRPGGGHRGRGQSRFPSMSSCASICAWRRS